MMSRGFLLQDFSLLSKEDMTDDEYLLRGPGTGAECHDQTDKGKADDDDRNDPPEA